VVDDKSTDSSVSKLERLMDEYGFVLVRNKRNMGKARSINRIAQLSKHEILVVVDADVVLTKKALHDLFARLEDRNVVAASCPYQPSNHGFLASMQGIEYNVLTFVQGAHNIHSALSLWGGCLAVKKKAFFQVGMLSPEAIVEDMDLALKLNKAGFRVEQSFVPVRTYVPDTFRSWYRQKVRWTSGSAQCVIKYLWIWLRNPLHILFILLFSLLSVLYVVSVIREFVFIDNIVNTFHLITEGATKFESLELTGFFYGAILLKNLLSNLYFTVFSIPYVIPMIHKPRQIYRLLWLVPFSLFYYPLFTLVSVIGVLTGFIRYRSLKAGVRAW